MCSRTLTGVLFPSTVQWGRSVTHPGPVATFSKSLCLAKGGGFPWFYLLPSVFVRQFDTSEKCDQGGTSVLEPLRTASWSWLQGTPRARAPPTAGTTGTPARAGQARPSPAHSASGDTSDTVVWTVCRYCQSSRGSGSHAGLWPQVAAWLQAKEGMPENGSGFSDDLNLLVYSGSFFPRDLGSRTVLSAACLDCWGSLCRTCRLGGRSRYQPSSLEWMLCFYLPGALPKSFKCIFKVQSD